MVTKGEKLKCVVFEVDSDRQRISLGVKQMTEDPWIRAIPEKYIPGQIVKGKVTKLTNFGAFVELEPELEGLLHISELADHKIDKPQDVVKEGDEVEVKILKVEPESRKIGLSLRRAQWAAENLSEEAEKTKAEEPVAAKGVEPAAKQGGEEGASTAIAEQKGEAVKGESSEGGEKKEDEPAVSE